MTTREILSDELEGLLALYKHLHTSDDPLPADDEVQGIWQEICASSRYRYFGAFAGGRLVSTCTLSVTPNLTRGCRPYGLIENVVTHPGYRRRGLGRMVLEFALAEAWNAGCYKVMLLTGRMDEGCFRFYESAGFRRNEKQGFVARPNQNER
ncbi:MAG: GNAT family N-acetyltransferase [Puniceicoccaceae bacterium]|nr:MAG: GNAT family N-acetyltransferase [Puniceicoccaceae bacterium]